MAIKSNLVIDIGNTRIKAARVSGLEVEIIQLGNNIEETAKNLPSEDKIIISSVVYTNDYLNTLFGDKNIFYLSHSSPVPIKIEYETPETLGIDRVAGAVACHFEFPFDNILLIDIGSCITYDRINRGGRYLGGMISPGINIRMKSLHTFTANLPDLSTTWQEYDHELIGKSTNQCIVSGVINGIINEMNGVIDRSQEEIPDQIVILTGGDAPYFESKIKAPIFVRPNLVMTGLNQILIYNEEN